MKNVRRAIVWSFLLIAGTWCIGSSASTLPPMIVLYGFLPAFIATALLFLVIHRRVGGNKPEWVAGVVSVLLSVSGYRESQPTTRAVMEVGNLFEDWRLEKVSGDLWMPYLWCFVSKKPRGHLETRLEQEGIVLKGKDQLPPSRMVFEFERIGRLKMENREHPGKIYEGWTRGNRWVQIFIPDEGERAFIKVTNRRIE